MERQLTTVEEIYLDSGEKEASRELWEEAFPEDSRSFDDYYFKEKLKDNRILALKSGDRLEAMIHLNPYLLQVKDRRWRIDYLVGVATRADRRHRGCMRRLLTRMMADMQAEETPFCFLMPADEAIYRPFGFTWIFSQPQWEWKDPDRLIRRPLLPWKDSLGNRRYLAELAGWMNRWLRRNYQVYAVRSTEYLLRLAREIASEQGTLNVVYDGDVMVGMESHWGFGKQEQRLLYGEASHVQEAAPSKPAIMARIISAKAFVKAVCLKDTVAEDEVILRLDLTDPLVPQNQGLWLWHLNHETSWLEREAAGAVTAAGVPECSERTDVSAPPEQPASVGQNRLPGLSLTITELTRWLFGYGVPEAAAPWTSLVQPLEGVFLDEVV